MGFSTQMSGNPTNQAGGDRLRFRAFLMPLFNPAALSPKQIEYRKRIRAKGRKHYIFYTGILRYGMSVFVLTTFWNWHGEYGWHVPPPGYFAFSIILGLVIWSP